MPDKDKVLTEDPFNLYDILNKRKDSGDDLKYPHGFTSSVINVEGVNEKVKEATSNEVNEHVNSTLNKLEESVPKGKLSLNNSVCLKRVHTGGSILELMDELVKETKMKSMELVTIKTLWGNSSFDYALSSSLGNSGGILCVWEPTLFVKDNVSLSDNFLAVMSTWVPSSSKLLIIFDGDFVIMGDFNEVRMEQERYGSVFNVQVANTFTSFISLASPIDLLLDGLLALFLFLSALCLDRNLSDHHPILMWELRVDYGPTPFRFFHSWFNLDGFEKMVEDTWKSLATVDSNAKISIQSKLFDIDKILDQGGSKEDIVSDRSLLLKELNDINSIDSLEVTQKSKVRWAIEGDENTKFFHGIFNSKRSQLAIHGTLVDSEWIVNPFAVKSVLSLEQQADLEQNVSNEEIKSAV
ncbi:RNA-directed DNA polymerase, eukaryota [Tanacetum coccineum]